MFYQGHKCQLFRDVRTMGGDTLAVRHRRTMSRLEQIIHAGYKDKVQWKGEFNNGGIVNKKPKLLTHPIVEQIPLHTRDALYGVRTEAMRLQ